MGEAGIEMATIGYSSPMTINGFAPQLRTTDMAATIRFYTENFGFTLDFSYEDFYAGLRLRNQTIHLKHVDEADPSIPYVDAGGHLHLYFETEGVAELADELKRKGVTIVKDVHETPWGTRETVVYDNQGHTLYFGEAL